MTKRIIAIGGGEIRNKTTLEIDRYVAELAKAHAGDKRANALFIGTASHDSMPYFNSFRKTYTSVFDIKAEVALMVYGEMDAQRIIDKINNADCIYIGGGDTVFMLEKWQELGITQHIINAYEQGKIICGLSAGAICWFKDMYTDYEIMQGKSADYVLKKGLNIIDGCMCPHFDEREKDFMEALKSGVVNSCYCVENNCALEFVDGKFSKSISAGGKAYLVTLDGDKVIRQEL
ncbi:MAG: peptidase E [Clostridiales bacterium]|nr:peptidase E [Clostridiales bacterium]